MSGMSFARRYWYSLTGADAPQGALAVGRGGAGYSFWQRYWASLVMVDLPVKTEMTTAGAAAREPEQRPPARHGPRRAAAWSGPGWFSLPPVPALGGLRAGDEEDLVAEVASPDGRVQCFVRRGRGAPARYRVEVVVRDDGALPAVVSVRYETVAGERLLIVPVVVPKIGPAASQVELPGFESGTIWASAPAPADLAGWDDDTVSRSVRAAVNEGTRAAWRQVREATAGHLQQVIDQALS
jgi:hypothetical protein